MSGRWWAWPAGYLLLSLREGRRWEGAEMTWYRLDPGRRCRVTCCSVPVWWQAEDDVIPTRPRPPMSCHLLLGTRLMTGWRWRDTDSTPAADVVSLAARYPSDDRPKMTWYRLDPGRRCRVTCCSVPVWWQAELWNIVPDDVQCDQVLLSFWQLKLLFFR